MNDIHKILFIATCLIKVLNNIDIIRIIVLILCEWIEIKFVCGRECTLLIKNNILYCWGKNDECQEDVDGMSIFFGQKISDNADMRSVACGKYRVVKLYVDSSTRDGSGIGNIDDVSCGEYFSFAVDITHGEVYAWGSNDFGQLGLGDYMDRFRPHKIKFPNIHKVICGANFTMFLTKDGTLLSCGRNGNGKLGLGDFDDRNVPTKISLSNVLMVSCGHGHSLILLKNNTLWMTGCISNIWDHQVGHPRKITLPNVNIISIGCGYNYSMALSKEGNIYCWGTPSKCTTFRDVHLSDAMKLNIRNITSIWCGPYHIIAQNATDNKLYGWGSNKSGQLGIGVCHGHRFLSKPRELKLKVL